MECEGTGLEIVLCLFQAGFTVGEQELSEPQFSH